MAIIVNKDTRVLVQGITGKESGYWTEKMIASGTRVVAGVTPGKGGAVVHGVPVYNLVSEAVSDGPVDLAVLYVPARFTREAVIEVLAAGIKVVVMLADGVPVHDMMLLKTLAARHGAVLVGPNTPGLATVGEVMIGFVPVWLEQVYRPGRIGLITRSGTLTNEVSSHITAAGLGISTLVGCGGDPLPGSSFADLLSHFAADEATDAVVIVGEIGGSLEEEAAEFIAAGGYEKPVLAYIAGRTAPPGKRMGHAGAIISGGKGSVADKKEVLETAGIKVAATPAAVGKLLRETLA